MKIGKNKFLVQNKLLEKKTSDKHDQYIIKLVVASEKNIYLYQYTDLIYSILY